MTRKDTSSTIDMQEIDFSNTQEISKILLKELEIELLKIRKEVDKILQNQDHGYEENYPIGHCGEIRDAVFEIIEDKVKKGNNIFHQLSEKGLNFNKIYGIEYGEYFQNSIQLGKYNINVAGDTVDINDNPIQIIELQNSGMENLSDYIRYCEIAEKYWGYEIIPNNYLPQLQNFYPFFFKRKDGVIFLPDFIGILNVKDSKNNFKLSKEFLKENKYKDNKLPNEYIEFIENSNYIRSQTNVGPINKEFCKLFLKLKKN